jgi:hypothetical protein
MDDFPWEQVKSGDLESLRDALFSSSTTRRTRALQELRDKIGSELPQEIRQSLLGLLFTTYPLYVDRPSRQAVQQCLRTILKAPVPPEDLKYLKQKLLTEASKPGLAPSSAFVLLEWCSLLLQILKKDPDTPLSIILDIVAVDAKALETCLAARPRPTVKQSALTVTRRALRAVFSSDNWGEDAVRQSVARLTGDSAAGQKNAPFLGVVSGVCARLPNNKAVLEQEKKLILAYYVKELIGSKAAVPNHIANGLSDFFASFITYEDFTSELVPPLEKSLLRAPEVVLGGLVPSLCTSLPEDFDLSEILFSRLLKHLLSSMKSNNATIRQGAVQSLESILSKSKNENWLVKIAGEIIGPLKTQKITSPEHRAMYAQAVCAILPSESVSKDIVQGLAPVFSRESNEVALEQEIMALCKHLTFLLQSRVKVSDDVINAVVKGIADKRIPFRKLWQLIVGDVFWRIEAPTLGTSEVGPFVTKFLDKMKDLFKEVTSNPLPSAQNGSLSAAFVYLALYERVSAAQGVDKADWETTVAQSMLLSPKPSFLLNHKAYTKLTSSAEIQWMVRALVAVSSGSKFESTEHAAKVAWAQAFIYATTAPGLRTNLREEAAHALTGIYLRRSELMGRVVTDALWTWILALRTAEKESAASSAGPASEKLLHLVAKAICPSAAEIQSDKIRSDLKRQLIQLHVLCRPELIPNVSWIALCLRTGTDPGDLVREYPDDFMKQLTQVQEDPIQSKVPGIDAAIWNAAGDLAFVAPDTMVPRLIQQISDDLDASRLSRFTPTDVAIARTPEGTMFVDILNTKSKQPAFDKNTKDYDTLKWEEELRAQLAQKKGQTQKKLTADEQAKVKAQLVKESKIREEVLQEVKRVERGAGIIQGLASGPAVDADGWINPAISSLLSLARAGVGLFAGDVVSKAYVKCAEKVSSRLGPLRPFVGVATLRAIGRSHLPPEMEAEPLGGLVTRILYRLRFASEQRPFDMTSLAYILPLIFMVLSRNGIEEVKGEEEGEQLLLALEFLSFHSGSCEFWHRSRSIISAENR